MKKLSIIAILLLIVGFANAQPENFKEIAIVKTTVPKDQAKAGTCWSFATTSFVETEVLRITGEEFDLSENFSVYYSYINKAKMYVRLQGLHQFGQGGQAHDVLDVISEYGLVTEEAYPYKNKDHTQLEKDLKSYLDSVISLDTLPRVWMAGYKKILNDALGTPPTSFEYNGKQISAKNFVKDILKFNTNDYVEVTSFSHHPFYQQFVLEVPDNWSMGLYHNVPITDLLAIMENGITNGYSIDWDGDVSEEGFAVRKGLAYFTKKGKGGGMRAISEQPYRQRLFDRQFTTDDHLMHAVGLYTDAAGEKQYLIKNSWGKYPPFDGYLYMSEEYVKYKTVAILVHKDAIPEEILEKK